MTIGFTLFITAVVAFLAVLVISFWANKLGGGLGGLEMLLVFLVSAVATLLFLQLAPENIQTIALYIGVGIVTLTLIVNLISGK